MDARGEDTVHGNIILNIPLELLLFPHHSYARRSSQKKRRWIHWMRNDQITDPLLFLSPIKEMKCDLEHLLFHDLCHLIESRRRVDGSDGVVLFACSCRTRWTQGISLRRYGHVLMRRCHGAVLQIVS